MSEPATDHEGRVRLVGTAHVSKESVEEVRETVTEERPDVVAVELDEARYRQLEGEGPDDLDPGDVLRGNTVFQFLAYWMLSYVQARLGERFDVEPGADMKAAVEVAEEHGTAVALVDRDINVTIQRFWARMTGREKLSLVTGLALGLAPPVYLGVVLGVSLGLVAGLVLGMGGVEALGLGGQAITAALGAATVRAVGVLVAGAALGLLIWGLAGDFIGGLLRAVSVPDAVGTRLLAGVVVGIVAVLAVALSGGLAVGPVALTPATLLGVGASTLTFLAGIVVGVVAFGALGLLAGLVLALAVDYDPNDLDDVDEFDVERMTDTDVVSVMMEEFRRFSPRGAEALIDERDAYIAHQLLALRAGGRNVVAVVGAGHVEGIETYLAHPERLPPIEELVERAKTRRFSVLKVGSYLFMLGFLAFFGLLAMAGVKNRFLLKLFLAWFVFHWLFTFGAAKLAGARWDSATVGGLVAWLTSINPLLAPGWFTGYVELRHTNVSVADIGRLNELLSDQESPLGTIGRRMMDVPLFRLIVIVAMANVGSVVASVLFFVVVVPWLGQDIGGADAVMAILIEGARNSAELVLGALG